MFVGCQVAVIYIKWPQRRKEEGRCCRARQVWQ